MWISTNQIGNRIGDLSKRFDSLERRLERLENELRTFQEMVNGKLAPLDLELAKLMDRGNA
jgi:chaperonin cofactor prefoldin